MTRFVLPADLQRRLRQHFFVRLLACLLMTTPVWAQSPAPGPQLHVAASLSAGQKLTVGATATLNVDVLTSTWFTEPPQISGLNIPGVLVSGPAGDATILRDNINGVAYSGLRYSYLISPTAAGPLRVPALTITAKAGQATAPLTAQTVELTLQASGPPDSAAGHMLAASAVQVSQQIQFSAQPPAVGDHISRVITVQAQGAQAMLIPPPAIPAVPGLKSYSAEPVLTQLSGSRGEFLGGQRVDRVDYVVERPGAYELPAVEIRWWNLTTNQEASTTVPAQRFDAKAGVAYQAPFSVEQDLRDMGRQVQVRVPGGWLALAAALVLAALTIWLGRPWWRRAAAGLRGYAQAQRERWRASEPYAARELRRSLNHPQGSLDALYRWLRRSRGAASVAQATAGVSIELQQAGAIALRDCYGVAPDSVRGFQTLRQAVPQWRRAFRAEGNRNETHRLLPLNPSDANSGTGSTGSSIKGNHP